MNNYKSAEFTYHCEYLTSTTAIFGNVVRIVILYGIPIPIFSTSCLFRVCTTIQLCSPHAHYSTVDFLCGFLCIYTVCKKQYEDYSEDIAVYKYEINVSSFSEVCFVVFTVFPVNTILPAMYIYGNIYYHLYMAISSFNSRLSSSNFLYMLFIHLVN